MRVKLGTGAEVTAISSGTHQFIGSPNLSPPSKVIYGSAHQILDVLEHFRKHGKHIFQEMISVVNGLKINLQAITILSLIRRIGDLSAEEEIFDQFPLCI